MSPTASATGRILSHRAARLAVQARAAGSTEETIPVLLSSVGGQVLAMRRAAVSQVVTTPIVTRLPGAPTSIGGVVQIKGELIAVVDLARVLGSAAGGDGALVVVVERDRKKLGLRVDSILGFRDIAPGELANTLFTAGEANAYPVEATTKDLVTILDLDRLYEAEQARVDRNRSHKSSRSTGDVA